MGAGTAKRDPSAQRSVPVAACALSGEIDDDTKQMHAQFATAAMVAVLIGFGIVFEHVFLGTMDKFEEDRNLRPVVHALLSELTVMGAIGSVSGGCGQTPLCHLNFVRNSECLTPACRLVVFILGKLSILETTSIRLFNPGCQRCHRPFPSLSVLPCLPV